MKTTDYELLCHSCNLKRTRRSKWRAVLSAVLEFALVFVALYLGWLFARWLNAAEAGESFWSAQGMLAGAEAVCGVGLLVLTIAWIFRKSLQRALSAWGEWG